MNADVGYDRATTDETYQTPLSEDDVRWAVNVLLETIAAKFDAWETMDIWRSEAASTVRSFKHDTSKEELPTLGIADNVLAEMERVKRLFERSSNDKEDLISYARDVAALRSQTGSEASRLDGGQEMTDEARRDAYALPIHRTPTESSGTAREAPMNADRVAPSRPSPAAHGAEVVGWRYQRKEGWGDVWRLSTCHPTNFETANDWTVQPLYATPSQPGIELREALEKLDEIINLDSHGRYGRLAREARAALTKATEAKK